jgi:hypothetical protein
LSVLFCSDGGKSEQTRATFSLSPSRRPTFALFSGLLAHFIIWAVSLLLKEHSEIYTDEQMSAPPRRHASIFLSITLFPGIFTALDRRLAFASPFIQQNPFLTNLISHEIKIMNRPLMNGMGERENRLFAFGPFAIFPAPADAACLVGDE